MSDPAKPYIGGQAVIEGVMMRAPKCLSVAVRRPDGSIALREGPLRARWLTSKWMKVPGVRGVHINALGYAGTVLLKHDEQLQSLQSMGVSTLLRQCTCACDAENQCVCEPAAE